MKNKKKNTIRNSVENIRYAYSKISENIEKEEIDKEYIKTQLTLIKTGIEELEKELY
jgi:hypothetical protein